MGSLVGDTIIDLSSWRKLFRNGLAQNRRCSGPLQYDISWQKKMRAFSPRTSPPQPFPLRLEFRRRTKGVSRIM